MVWNSAHPKPEDVMFDASLLEKLDFSDVATKFNPPITTANAGEPWIKVRPLQTGDYDRGFLQLLTQLTDVENIPREEFLDHFYKMKHSGCHYTVAVEDTRINQVIGTMTLVIEYKFIHKCDLRAHLEELVINNSYRGKQLGKLLVTTAILLAQEFNCYKINVVCKDDLSKFYMSFGFTHDVTLNNNMQIRFDLKSEPSYSMSQLEIQNKAENE